MVSVHAFHDTLHTSIFCWSNGIVRRSTEVQGNNKSQDNNKLYHTFTKHLHILRFGSTNIYLDAELLKPHVTEQNKYNYTLTLCLLVSSADNLCKKFGPRSGLTYRQAWSGSKRLTLWLYSWNDFSKKLILEKKSADAKKHAKLPKR